MDEITARYGRSVFADALRARMRPAVAFAFADGGSSRSRFGGAPRLPPEFAWPLHVPEVVQFPPTALERLGLTQPEQPSGPQPLDFLLQIDLAELHGLGGALPVPSCGLLTFFYDVETQPWGYDPAYQSGFCVALFEQDVLLDRQPPRPAPFEARGLRFWGARTLPHVGSRAYDEMDADDDIPEDYEEFASEFECRGYPAHGGLHRLGGHSANVQGDMQLEAQLVSHGLYCGDSSGYSDPRAATLEAEAAEWVLLLQLDTDEHVGMMWGDAGMLYFWIRHSDLVAKRFDRCWMTLQCG